MRRKIIVQEVISYELICGVNDDIGKFIRNDLHKVKPDDRFIQIISESNYTDEPDVKGIIYEKK